ncbi:MAG: SDR family oxidoreductase [Chloroflexi bacterium]|nr:SDR family oxidoreductase [Chloroflexota bacterium]MCI0580318.1 SDR family oxidoreductase [Chloroflexota bacterium]MCI0648535.1 SDR family oxidoreductase [Chloroflexota bacterium]MCI0728485.1 SDR family oxidoreductase [Chloroflexota bacterium]
MKQVVITGVSTGIGRAAAEELIRHGYHVFGSVRREADGATAQQALGERFTPLLFDVTDEGAIQAAAAEVERVLKGQGLAGLVNNAGIVVPGPLMHLPLADIRYQFEVNVVGVVAVTQAFLPLLGAKKNTSHLPGRIVNISSVSGRIAYPFMAPYAASKHALEALSDSLRRELMLYGIDVIVIEPGSVQTPIWDKAAELDVNLLADTDYFDILPDLQRTMVKQGRQGIPVEKVAQVIREALENKRPKTRYVLAREWLKGWILPRWLPDRWFDRIVADRIGFKR